MRFSDIILLLSSAVATVSVGVVDASATFTPQNVCDAQKLSQGLTNETTPKQCVALPLVNKQGARYGAPCDTPQDAEAQIGGKREIEDRQKLDYVPALWKDNNWREQSY
ncbi:hypothetical protein V8E53_014876 [Lactarius tabidus]